MRSTGSERIVNGIRNSDRKILCEIYKAYYPPVSNFVINNHGSEDDARDIFQESIIIIFKKIKNDELKLSVSFYKYLFAVCKNLWLNEIRWKLKKNRELDYYYNFFSDKEGDKLCEAYRKNCECRLFYKHFKNLSEECRRLISLYLQRIRTKIIAKTLNINDVSDVKTRKYKCKVILMRNIRNDPEFEEIVNHEQEPELRHIGCQVSGRRSDTA